MVPADGTHQLDQQVFVVNPLKETAVYVERMPGGVRGGGREAPLYSMCARHDVNLEGASPLQAVVVGTVS